MRRPFPPPRTAVATNASSPVDWPRVVDLSSPRIPDDASTPAAAPPRRRPDDLTTRDVRAWERARRVAEERLVPGWLGDYLRWHQHTRSTLAPPTEGDPDPAGPRGLILCCRHGVDPQCGGLADRLKSLPRLVQLAAQSQRLFLIHWTHPAPLTAFLTPPAWTTASSADSPGVSLDWTVPPWLWQALEGHDPTRSRFYTSLRDLSAGVFRNDTRFVLARIQDQHGGSSQYNEVEAARRRTPRTTVNRTRDDSTSTSRFVSSPYRAFRAVYGPLFRILFAPSPPVARAIQHALQQQLHVTPNRYVAAHLRTQYGRHPLAAARVRSAAANAVQCASTLWTHPQQSLVVFLSDSVPARHYIRDQYPARGRKRGIDGPDHAYHHPSPNVTATTTITHHNHPTYGREEESRAFRLVTALPVHENDTAVALHLDHHHTNRQNYTVEDYYPIFVDLYLMAYASAVAHAQGGFGRLGVLLSYEPTHFVTYFTHGHWVACEWHDPPATVS